MRLPVPVEEPLEPGVGPPARALASMDAALPSAFCLGSWTMVQALQLESGPSHPEAPARRAWKNMGRGDECAWVVLRSE